MFNIPAKQNDAQIIADIFLKQKPKSFRIRDSEKPTPHTIFYNIVENFACWNGLSLSKLKYEGKKLESMEDFLQSLQLDMGSPCLTKSEDELLKKAFPERYKVWRQLQKESHIRNAHILLESLTNADDDKIPIHDKFMAALKLLVREGERVEESLLQSEYSILISLLEHYQNRMEIDITEVCQPDSEKSSKQAAELLLRNSLYAYAQTNKYPPVFALIKEHIEQGDLKRNIESWISLQREEWENEENGPTDDTDWTEALESKRNALSEKKYVEKILSDSIVPLIVYYCPDYIEETTKKINGFRQVALDDDRDKYEDVKGCIMFVKQLAIEQGRHARNFYTSRRKNELER